MPLSTEQAVKRFKFFPDMHRLLSSRPNVVPTVVQTGMTPSGPFTFYPQPPSPSTGTDAVEEVGKPAAELQIDPALLTGAASNNVAGRKVPVQVATPAIGAAAIKAPTASMATPTKAVAAHPPGGAVATAGVGKQHARKRSLEEAILEGQE